MLKKVVQVKRFISPAKRKYFFLENKEIPVLCLVEIMVFLGYACNIVIYHTANLGVSVGCASD